MDPISCGVGFSTSQDVLNGKGYLTEYSTSWKGEEKRREERRERSDLRFDMMGSTRWKRMGRNRRLCGGQGNVEYISLSFADWSCVSTYEYVHLSVYL